MGHNNLQLFYEKSLETQGTRTFLCVNYKTNNKCGGSKHSPEPCDDIRW